MRRKILVAGGSGFIGSHIVAELWKAGEHVAVLSRHADSARRKLGNIDVDYVSGDVRDPHTLDKPLSGAECVICCVQFPGHPIENPARGYTYEKFDAAGTRHLVEAALRAGAAKRFIYLSGAGTREDRPDLDRAPWFRAKVAAERVVKTSGIPYTIFRPSWVYGREDNGLNKFVTFARMLPFLPILGDGKNRIQPLFIVDLAKTIAAAVNNRVAENQVYEIGGPDTLTMDQMMRMLLKVLGKRRPLLHIPKLPLSPKFVDFITMENLVDNARVMTDFGAKLTPFEEGISSYLAPAPGETR